jgi:hypothetical protein
MLAGGYTIRPPAAGCRSVELSVLWSTDDEGTPEMGVCHYEAREAGGDLSGTRAFHVRLPAGPFSYCGQKVVIRWVVRLRLRCNDGEEYLSELPFQLRAASPE